MICSHNNFLSRPCLTLSFNMTYAVTQEGEVYKGYTCIYCSPPPPKKNFCFPLSHKSEALRSIENQKWALCHAHGGQIQRKVDLLHLFKKTAYIWLTELNQFCKVPYCRTQAASCPLSQGIILKPRKSGFTQSFHLLVVSLSVSAQARWSMHSLFPTACPQYYKVPHPLIVFHIFKMQPRNEATLFLWSWTVSSS